MCQTFVTPWDIIVSKKVIGSALSNLVVEKDIDQSDK